MNESDDTHALGGEGSECCRTKVFHSRFKVNRLRRRGGGDGHGRSM